MRLVFYWPYRYLVQSVLLLWHALVHSRPHLYQPSNRCTRRRYLIGLNKPTYVLMFLCYRRREHLWQILQQVAISFPNNVDAQPSVELDHEFLISIRWRCSPLMSSVSNITSGRKSERVYLGVYFPCDNKYDLDVSELQVGKARRFYLSVTAYLTQWTISSAIGAIAQENLGSGT